MEDYSTNLESFSIEELEMASRIINSALIERKIELKKIKKQKFTDLIKNTLSLKITDIKDFTSEIKNKVSEKVCDKKDMVLSVGKNKLDEFKNKIKEIENNFNNTLDLVAKKSEDIYDGVKSKLSDAVLNGVNNFKSIKGKIVEIYDSSQMIKATINDKFANSKDRIVSFSKEKIDLFKQNVTLVTDKVKESVQGVKENAKIMTYDVQIKGLNFGISAKEQAIIIYDASEILKTKIKDKTVSSKDKIVSLGKNKIDAFKNKISAAIVKARESVQGVKENAKIMAYDVQIEGLKLGISAKKQIVEIYNAAEVVKENIKDKVVEKKEKIISFTSEKISNIKTGIKNTEIYLKSKAEATKQNVQEGVEAVKEKGKEIILPAIKLGTDAKNRVIGLYNTASDLTIKAKEKVYDTKTKIITASKDQISNFKSGVKNLFTPTPEKLAEYQQMINQRKVKIAMLKEQYASVGNDNLSDVSTGMAR